MAVDGLRERKKARLRREISDVATHLFAEHGFEQVTLAQIADAADVSIKTIFNHFGSKEDLYFDRADEVRDGIVATIAERPEDTTVLGALRAFLVDNLVPFSGMGWPLNDPERLELFRRFMETQDRSPALRARRLTLAEELGEHLSLVLADELDRLASDPEIEALSAMLVATMSLRDRVLRAALLDGAGPRVVRRQVVGTVNEAFDRLEAAFGDLDRPREAAPAAPPRS